MPGGVDDRGVRRMNGGGDLDDFGSLDEHVADRVIADPLVHRQHGSAFDQRAPALDADPLGHRGRCGAMRGFRIGGRSVAQARICGECGGELAGPPPAPDAATSQIWHMASSLLVRPASALCDRPMWLRDVQKNVRMRVEDVNRRSPSQQWEASVFSWRSFPPGSFPEPQCIAPVALQDSRYCPRFPRAAKRTASSAARKSARALLTHSVCSAAGDEL